MFDIQISEELKDHLDIFNDPERIFNCDETAVFLHPKSRPVLATRGQKNVYDVSGTCNKENLTILITGNAAGKIAPPLALVSFKKIPSDMAATANPDWSIGKTPNGWMTCQSFFEYVANVFEPYIKGIQKPVILFLDGHRSHISLQLSQFCLEKQIILISLPPNATHIMQPLDVCFFGPLKSSWKVHLQKFRLTKNMEPKKCHVLPILESLLSKPNFAADLKKGFQICGLCPLNPDNVDYTKCLEIGEFETQENCTQIQANNKCNQLLQSFGESLPISIKKKFDALGADDEWTGNQKLTGLFNFYKSVKYNSNFEDIEDDEPCTSTGIQGVEMLESIENEENSHIETAASFESGKIQLPTPLNVL